MLRRLLTRLALAVLLGVLVAVLPLGLVFGPALEGPRTAVAAIVLVCLLGKLLYDTLFYDRYQPK